MDALVIPLLGVLIAIFLIYIAVAWIGDKNKRALQIREDDDDDSAQSDPY